MGCMSRRVVPACGNLCFMCPALRARSRQPVKRYKKLIANIFPRSHLLDGMPNDRNMSKLCEYASKNPLRIPKITENLEHRCYKDLRNEHFASVKIVVCIYKKLLSSSKEHMPLFANSLLHIVGTLLEQTRHDEMCILGCNLLVDFINNQMDSTYMFNLEGLIPKLCQLAQEVGEDDRALSLRSAGLQVLAVLVWFIGEYSHISMDFDNIVAVILENYLDTKDKKNNKQCLLKTGEDGLSFPDKINDMSLPDLGNNNPGSDPTMDVYKTPSYWSRVCLQNMAGLAKEATTVRRVLEPLFRSFDSGNDWSPESGVACSILSEMQWQMEKSGHKSHVMLSILVKHLDHRDIVSRRNIQIDIIKITTHLAQQANISCSVSIVGAISDLIKHLSHCMLFSAEAFSNGDVIDNSNDDLQSALEDCIAILSNKVGDVGPIFDMMATVLENIPNTDIVARAFVFSVYRTAQLTSTLPNISYYRKAFPDALFHQLILAMAHSNPDTRVGAHRIFSIVLLPSFDHYWSSSNKIASIALSGLYSSDRASYKSSRSISGTECKTEVMDDEMSKEINQKDNLQDDTISLSRNPSQSFKLPSPYVGADDKEEVISLRLSSHQVGLLLSSIWTQATFAENTPACFEALAHSYSLVVLFSLAKSSHVALVRCFQLAFSLRSISLDPEGSLRPTRRRSLFTLASAMFIFSAKAANIPDLITLVKAALTDETVDPFLELINDMKLQAVAIKPDSEKTFYGSQEDEIMASQCLLKIDPKDEMLKKSVMSYFMKTFGQSVENVEVQLIQRFVPDDVYPLGAALFMEASRPSSPVGEMVYEDFNEMPAAALTDDEAFTEACGTQSDQRSSLAMNTLEVLSVNELLESVLETARQVASFPVSSAPIPYDQMKNQCEALVTGKHQKMSVLLSFKNQQEIKGVSGFPEETGMKEPALSTMELQIVKEVQAHDQMNSSTEYEQFFRLPPSSPYDKFLKAAGC